MPSLTESILEAGLSQLGPAVSATHVTHAFLALDASNQQLTDIDALTNYPYLQTIDLSHNELESLAPLSSCASLRHLDVSHNKLSVLLDCSAAPRALRSLCYSHNNLSGALQADNLLQHKHLERLDLSVNRLEELDGIGELLQLRELNVARNQLSSLAAISCPALVTLDASSNFLKALHTLPGAALQGTLRTLRLDGNQISSLEGVEQLSLLTVLSLRDNALSSLDEVARLSACPQLVELDLSGNPLTDDASYRHKLLHILPHLHSLDGRLVTAEEVVEAHNAHGADQVMRDAITTLYLPQSNATQPHMAPRQAPELVLEDEAVPSAGTSKFGATSSGAVAPLPATAAAAAAVNTASSTLLPESPYWSLLGERKFTPEWAEFLRVAKNRIGDSEQADAEGVTLDLGGIALGEAGAWGLSELLSVRRTQISSLVLNHSLHPLRWSARLGDFYGLRRVLRSMAQLQNLHSLSLSHCHLGRESGNLLAGYLGSAAARQTLRNLNLANNLLGQNVTTSLPQTKGGGGLVVVHACPGLKAVVGALTAASGSSEAHALEYLNLSNNLIDPQGARILASYLSGGAQSASGSSENANDGEPLYFESGSLSSAAAALSSSTSSSPLSLRTLILDSNSLQDEGLISLSLALRSNTSLTSLSLRGNGSENSFGSRGFQELALSVGKYNRNLNEIDLGNNPSMFVGDEEIIVAEAEEEEEEEEDDEQEENDGRERTPRAPRRSPAVSTSSSSSSPPPLAGQALASLLFDSRNGRNEAGSNLLSLRLDATGMQDRTLRLLGRSLQQNQSLLSLDLSHNGSIGEQGLEALFASLTSQARSNGGSGGTLRRLKITGVILGEGATLRLADWLSTSTEIQELSLGVVVREGGLVSSAWGAQQRDEVGHEVLPLSEEEYQSLREHAQQTRKEDLSPLALSTLAGALTIARSRQLVRLALGDLGANGDIVVEQLAAPVSSNVAATSAEPDDGNGAEDGAPSTSSSRRALLASESVPRDVLALPQGGSLTSLNLGGNTLSTRSMSLLAAALGQHASLSELLLPNCVLDGELDAEASFSELFSAVLANPSLVSVDLSGTQITSAGLQGIGAALAGPDGAGVASSALQNLDLSFCGLDEFAPPARQQEEEDAKQASSSKFLSSLQLDATSLTALSLRGNVFSSAELTTFLSALDANWNVRRLDLGEILLRQGEETNALLKGLVKHAVSHGLGSLTLPAVKQPSGSSAAQLDRFRDGLVTAVADGWKSGVSAASAFLRETGRTPESVLHQLRLELGPNFHMGAPLGWQHKQRLLEAIRPLSQSSTANRVVEESFRLVALTAGGVPLRLNTQQHGVCGVDLVENALAARLACQRM